MPIVIEALLNSAWSILKRYWPEVLAGVGIIGLCIAFAWVRHQRDDARAQVAVLQTWQGQAIATITSATVPAKSVTIALSPPEALVALNGLVKDRDDARANLATISAQTAADKARADQADAALADLQAKNVQLSKSSAATIAKLQAMTGSGDATKDCAAIDGVAGSAWEAWK